jgi:hypothetical protein
MPFLFLPQLIEEEEKKKKKNLIQKLIITDLIFSQNWSHRSVENPKIGKNPFFRTETEPARASQIFRISSIGYTRRRKIESRIYHNQALIHKIDNTNQYIDGRYTHQTQLVTISNNLKY